MLTQPVLTPPARPLPAATAGIGLLSRAAVHLMAADPTLACDGSTSVAAAAEFRSMVSQLHEAGIEVYLMVSAHSPRGGLPMGAALCSCRLGWSAWKTCHCRAGVASMWSAGRGRDFRSSGVVELLHKGCPCAACWPPRVCNLRLRCWLFTAFLTSPPPAPAAWQLELTFTAEGTDTQPNTLSLRGLDYGSYYRSNGVGRHAALVAGCLGASCWGCMCEQPAA